MKSIDQEVGLGMVHVRHRKLGLARELAEHVGLEREVGRAPLVSRSRLDREMPSIGEPDLKPYKPEPDGHRARIDHGRAERASQVASMSSPCSMDPALTLSANVTSLKQTHVNSARIVLKMRGRRRAA